MELREGSVALFLFLLPACFSALCPLLLLQVSVLVHCVVRDLMYSFLAGMVALLGIVNQIGSTICI